MPSTDADPAPSAPSAPPDPRLRTYQADLKAAIYASLQTNRRTLAQLPTGGGKSVIIESIVADAVRAHRSTIVLAHRIELVEQLADRLARFNPSVVTAGARPRPDAMVYIAMVQTLARRTPPLANLIIIDEAHHAVAGQYRAITDQLPNARIIGFTATPQRMDGKGLADVFDDLVCGPSVSELMADGWLSPYTVYSTPLDGLDGVKVTAGDYNKRDVATLVERSVIRGDITRHYHALAEGRQGIVFAASVALSEQYAREYNEAGIPAAHLDGNTDRTTRERAIDAFRAGDIRILTNCSLITEGFDVPACDMVQLVRPTRSLAMYLQMVGRALRPSDRPAVILDHAECVLRNGFPDDDREWTLTTKRRRKPRTVDIESIDIGLPTGNTGSARSSPEHDRTVQLVRVTPQDPLPEDLRKLINVVDRNGYTNSRGKPDYFWAYKRWLEAGNKPDEQTLKHFAKHAGYHHMWVKHQKRVG